MSILSPHPEWVYAHFQPDYSWVVDIKSMSFRAYCRAVGFAWSIPSIETHETITESSVHPFGLGKIAYSRERLACSGDEVFGIETYNPDYDEAPDPKKVHFFTDEEGIWFLAREQGVFTRYLLTRGIHFDLTFDRDGNGYFADLPALSQGFISDFEVQKFDPSLHPSPKWFETGFEVTRHHGPSRDLNESEPEVFRIFIDQGFLCEQLLERGVNYAVESFALTIEPLAVTGNQIEKADQEGATSQPRDSSFLKPFDIRLMSKFSPNCETIREKYLPDYSWVIDIGSISFPQYQRAVDLAWAIPKTQEYRARPCRIPYGLGDITYRKELLIGSGNESFGIETYDPEIDEPPDPTKVNFLTDETGVWFLTNKGGEAKRYLLTRGVHYDLSFDNSGNGYYRHLPIFRSFYTSTFDIWSFDPTIDPEPKWYESGYYTFDEEVYRVWIDHGYLCNRRLRRGRQYAVGPAMDLTDLISTNLNLHEIKHDHLDARAHWNGLSHEERVDFLKKTQLKIVMQGVEISDDLLKEAGIDKRAYVLTRRLYRDFDEN